MSEEVIGYRGLCNRCEYGEKNETGTYCRNKESKFFGLQVSSVLCAPCFTPEKAKANVNIQAVGFGD